MIKIFITTQLVVILTINTYSINIDSLKQLIYSEKNDSLRFRHIQKLLDYNFSDNNINSFILSANKITEESIIKGFSLRANFYNYVANKCYRFEN